MELGPGHDDADVHEAGKVEQDVDARVDLVVALLRLGQVLAVPVERDAGAEAGQQVVGREHARRADDEHGHGHGEQQVALAVDPLLAQAKLDQPAAAEADRRPVHHRQHDRVQPRLEQPVPHGRPDAAVQTPNVARPPKEPVRNLDRRLLGRPAALLGRLEHQARELGVAHQVGRQHQEREAEAVVGPRLGADDLTQRPRHVLVGKGALGDGLAQHGVRGRQARPDHEAGQQRQLGDRRHQARRRAQPRDGHGRQQQHRHVLPPLDRVLGRQLEPRDHQLHRDHDPHEPERDGALVLLTERPRSPPRVV